MEVSQMLNQYDVAKYFLSLDKENKYFNKKLVTRNGRQFYEGNARLNKMLHLAQNIYVAKSSKLLIDATFYAYDNGAVLPDIQENYGRLLSQHSTMGFDFSDEEEHFLQQIFNIFKDAPLDELISLDHEDPEWKEKHNSYKKEEQKMDTLVNVEEYKRRYKDILKVMDRMEFQYAN